MATDLRYPIKRALEKLQSLDSDIRFMALSDLNESLSSESSREVLSSDVDYTHTLCSEVLAKLSDPVTEVQNQAVRCLKSLVRRIDKNELDYVTIRLVDKLVESTDNVSIKLMAVRGIISNSEATESSGEIFMKYIVSFLWQLPDENWSEEHVAILFDLISRYGPILATESVELIELILMKPLKCKTGLTRRRAVTALGVLSRYLTEPKFDALIQSILEGLDQDDPEVTKTQAALSGAVSKNDPIRFKVAVKGIFLKLLKRLSLDTLEKRTQENDNDDDDDAEDSQTELEVRDSILAVFENYLTYQPDEIEPFLPDLLKICQMFIKHDPNYIDDDDTSGDGIDNDNDSEMGNADDSDAFASEGEFDGDFSDDEDQSWKLRRSAAKLSSILCLAYPKDLVTIFDALLEFIIKRIPIEREEAVQTVLVNALLTFITSTAANGEYYKLKNNLAFKNASSKGRRLSDASMVLLDSDPLIKLSNHTSSILNIALEGIEKSSSRVSEMPDLYITVLDKLISVVDEIQKDDLKHLISKLYALSQKKPPFLIGVLQLTKTIITRSEVLSIDGYMLKQLMAIVLDSLRDTYYKIVTESLNCCLTCFETVSDVEIIKEAVPLTELEKDLELKILSTSVDLETKEKSVKVLGELLSIPGGADAGILVEGCNMLADIISNEGLKAASLGAINLVVKGSGKGKEQGQSTLPLDWICYVIDSVLPLKNSSNRSLRLASLSVIEGLVSRLQEFSRNSATDEVTDHICQQISDGIAVGDYQTQDILVNIVIRVLPLCLDRPKCVQAIVAFTLSTLSIKDTSTTSTSAGASVSSNATEEDISANASQRSYLTFSNDTVKLLKAVVKEIGTKPFESVKHKQSPTELEAQAEAILIGLNHEKERLHEIISSIIKPGNNQEESAIESRLRVVGYYGQHIETLDPEIVVNIFSVLNEESQSQKLRICAAQALGCAISHHIPEYLDNLLKGLSASRDKKTNLLLVSLRQVIISAASSNDKSDYEKLVKASSKIWDTLFGLKTDLPGHETAAAKSTSGVDERELIAECLGSLSTIDPASFIAGLRAYLKPEADESSRATALDALRYSFDPLNKDHHQESLSEYEEHILPIVLDILDMPPELSASTPEMSQKTLGVLVAITHKRPELLMGYLDKLFPYINQYTYPNPELVRSVQMGPFKHKVDDGLDARKTAFEAIYVLVNSVDEETLKQADVLDSVLSRVLDGLLDEHEIKVLSLFILGKLAHTDINIIMAEDNLNSLIDKLTAMTNKKVKESAIKQEFEKQNEILRNVERTSEIINTEISEKSSQLNEIKIQKWHEFCNTMSTITKRTK